ncbi:hypothetical protein ACFV23_25585 [Streptomyces sp. NPDC059627]
MERDLVQRLGPLARQARDLLLPLAYTQGAGLPWAGVWPRLAAALTGERYGDEHIVWLRQAAGSYVVESVESGGSVYRVYHRALIEYLREGRDAAAIQRTVTRVLRDIEHPYARRYLALHAGEGGVLDPLVQDAGFVLGAEPGPLLAALPGLRTPEGRRAGQAVRDLEERLRHREGAGTDPEIRARLRLAAVCRKAQVLADSCDTGEGALPWRARWAAWNPHEGNRRYAGMMFGVGNGVVVPHRYGARFLDLSPWDGAMWCELDRGTWHQVHPQRGDPSAWTITVTPQVDGAAAGLTWTTRLAVEQEKVVTKNYARLLYLWRAYGRRTWLLPPAPTDTEPQRRVPESPSEVAVLADADGEAATAVLRLRDGRLLVYKLGGVRAHPPLTRGQRRALWDFEIRDWEERAEELAAEFLFSVDGAGLGSRITTCAAPSGLPTSSLLLGLEGGEVVWFNIGSGATDFEVHPGHEGPVTRIELVTGHPQGALLVTAGEDRTVRLSSFTAGKPLRTLLRSTSAVASFAVHRVGRQWIVAVVTADGQLHRIDLDSGRPTGLPLRVDPGTASRVAAFDLGSTACVSVQGNNSGLQLYDLVSGERVGGQVRRHAAAAVCAAGGTVCAGGSDGVVRFWPSVHAADSVQITAHQGPLLAAGEIRGPGGAPALVTVGEDARIRCWDLDRPHELWRRRVLDPGLWEVPLIGCAAIGHTADGRSLVVTGEHGGRVAVLVLRDGLPVAEQEFTLPEIVTAVTAGRIRGRDVVVVGTGSGRLACWDVGAGRMYALGPDPEEPVWLTALALTPDGSGRLAAGAFDGSVQEWSLPGYRPLGPARAAHRGTVLALSHAGGRLFGCGTDSRLVCLDDGWERRMPQPVGSLHATRDGLLCGDEAGQVWQVRETPEGRRAVELLDAVRPVSAVAALALDGGGGLAVVAGSADGSLQIRDGETGALVRRLRPVGDGGVEQLATVAWRSPGRAVRPLLFARGTDGLLEYWDFDAGGAVPSAGRPLVTPVPHQRRERVRLAVLPDGPDAQALLSLAVWDARPNPLAYGTHADHHVAVHDIASGPRHDQPCAAEAEEADIGAVRAVRCAGRLLVLVHVHGVGVRVLDTSTRRWAVLHGLDMTEAFALTGPGGDELLVTGGHHTRIIAWEALLPRFTGPDERPPRHRPATGGRRLYRRPPTPPPVAHEHVTRLEVDHAALLPDGLSYAVACGDAVVVLGTRTGVIHCEVELPSPCTALATGPHGELVVGTRNGIILFD